jgi:hypothetical protein
MVIQVDEAQVEARSGPFRDSANFVAKIVARFALNVPDGTPRNVGHVKSCCSPFGDSVSVSAR